jgi:thioredoxin-dependent peroxiredoxin
VALSVGTEAPDFEVVARQAGVQRRIKLSELRGNKNVVLYFYPRDFTPVCTKEACGFRDMYEELQGQGTEVIGVSVDDDASHDRFAAQHHVTFPLVADPQRVLARAYEATSWLRELMGGTSRITYVIDKQGKIVAVLKSELSAKQHFQGARAALSALR